MNTPPRLETAGSLCTGYGGLDGVLSLVLGTETIWTADNDPDVTTLLAYRFGGVPNLGDIKQADWSQVERPDVLCFGFPCQDISPAGKRAGIQPGNRSGLWEWLTYAIKQLRPAYVFIENSRSLTSAKAYSDVEQCAFCLGDGSRKPALRALGRVHGDLADLGYDAEWTCVRASAVGAPHDRHRAFVWAWDRSVADPGCVGLRGPAGDSVGSPVPVERRSVSEQRQRLRFDDRTDRADAADTGRDGSSADAEHEGSSRPPDGGSARLRLEAWRAGRQSALDDRQSARVDIADADSVRSRPRRKSEPGQAPGGESFGVLVRRDRTSIDADADCRRQRPDEQGVRQRAADSERSADADPAEHGRQERRAEREGLGGRSDDADDRRATADTGSTRLEVRTVKHHGPERETVERDHRDRLSDALGERRLGRADVEIRRPAERTAARRDRTSADVGNAETWRRAALADRSRRNSDRRIHDGDAPENFAWVVGERDYTQAVKTWEAVTGRRAPLPAVPNRRGDYRLNPRFSEWMMGLPDGWVTAVPGLSRTAQLRIIGNGVVPAQGALALLALLEAAELDR